MVCWSWNGEFPTSYHVDHIDGQKLDNRPEKLEAVPAIVNTFRAYVNYYTGDRARTYKNYVINEFDKAKTPEQLLELMRAIINDQDS